MVMYLLLLILWGNYAPKLIITNLNYRIGSYGHMYSRLQNIKDFKDLDILFLGSSHAYRGFDTRIFEQYGLNTFNLGSSSQTPIQTEFLLKKYLNILNPKLIIYEVYPGSFGSDGVESSLDIIANEKIDNETIKMVFKQNHLKLYNTLIYDFYRELFKKNIGFKEEVIKHDDTYIKGGFVEKQLRYFKYMDYKKENKWIFNEQQFNVFENILLLLKNRNIPFVLVQAPITQSKYQSYANNSVFNEKIKDYGIYFNFNEILQLDDKLNFYDSHHLNQSGVNIFNTILIDILLGIK